MDARHGFDAPNVSIVAIFCSLLVPVAGCTGPKEYLHNCFKVGPNYQQPTAPVSPAWIDSADPRVHGDPADLHAWWTAFQDPILNSLIETAYRDNLDVKTAATRILQARARRNIEAGNLFPQSQTAVAGYAHAQVSQNLGLPFPTIVNLWGTGFNASWELDFWGRLRRTVESANANFDASLADYDNALVILLAEVATHYVQLRTFEQRLVFARKNAEIQQGVLKIAEARFEKGITTELDVQQARANLAQTEAIIPPLRAGAREANNQLCILLGVPPRRLAECLGPASIPNAPSEVVVGVPAELLRRRPDIQQAERQVAAQSALIGVAEADLYPRFVLFGFIGYTADNFNKLFDASSFTSLVAPIFQWNILNYGRLSNNIRLQKAHFEELVLQYQQTVLRAQREAENALVNFLESQEQVRSLAASVTAYERSVELVVAQYRAGTVDFNRVFTTQAALVTEQDQLTAARGSIAMNLIALYRSLGGGWEIRVGKDSKAPCVGEFTVKAPPPEPVEQAPVPRRENVESEAEKTNRPSAAHVID